MNRNVLTISGLSKKYDKQLALNNVSFQIPEGSVFGIIGPNGSGKTTFLGIIMDIIKASSGEFTWLNSLNSAEGRKKIGALIETPNFYPYLTAVQNLEITARIKGQDGSDIDEILELLSLNDTKNKLYSTYSLGMKQRLAVAACLLGDPEILLLDEPTNGLDPLGITDLRNLIKTLRGKGKTIIFASHLLDEVEKLCSHVAILYRGELITAGKVEEVLTDEVSIEVGSDDLPNLLAALQNLPGLSRTVQEELFIRTFFEKDKGDPLALFRYCCENRISMNHLRLCRKSIETSFLELIDTH